VTEGGRLLARIDSAWDELSYLVDALDPEDLTLTGDDGWAVKDHLTHVAAWERWLIGLLERGDRWAAMGLSSEGEKTIDSVNAAILSLHQGKSGDEALAYFHETHEELMPALERMSDSDFQLPYSDYQPGAAGEKGSDQAVMVWVAANTYDHYAEHVEWIKALARR
jgi:hypothetical protein